MVSVKNAKTVLFAGLIVAMLLPFGSMYIAQATDDQTKQDFENDVIEW